jgi:hypothetical protein
MNFADVNQAIVRYLSKYPFWTDEGKLGLRKDLGPEGLDYIEGACEFAIAQHDLWLQRPFDEAFFEVQKRLRSKFPELDPAPIELIARLASYSWR